VALSGTLKALAANLMKFIYDIRPQATMRPKSQKTQANHTALKEEAANLGVMRDEEFDAGAKPKEMIVPKG